MTRDQAVLIIRSITIAYPNFEMSQEKLVFWLNHLMTMPFGAIQQNLNAYIRTSSFPPTISQIAVQEKAQNDFLKQLDERRRLLNAE
ncbi:hypothetical protein FZC66_19455 [Priestia megaterium]|nr:hypothetical protein FZC66_19455 [Priestia megaterium]